MYAAQHKVSKIVDAVHICLSICPCLFDKLYHVIHTKSKQYENCSDRHFDIPEYRNRKEMPINKETKEKKLLDELMK